MSKYDVNYLYEHEQGHLHLSSLITDLGERTLYDAASQCSRCGYCETACPTYMHTGREPISSRGRVQAVRMLIEGKLKDRAAAEESLSTCLLCGACTSACNAKVATPDIVLEARRASTGHGRSIFARLAVDTLLNRPELFYLWLKAGNLLKRLGFARLAGLLGVYDLLGMPALGRAAGATSRAPLRFLRDFLRRDPELRDAEGKAAAWAYFAPCGPNFMFTEVGRATVEVLKKLKGPGVFVENACCGLLAYNYGDLPSAREFAAKNVARYEELEARHPGIPVVADCSSCAAFMKSYEQLFSGDEAMRPRAARFAAAVKDVLETVSPDDLPKGAETPFKDRKVTYHDSCRACHGQGIRREPREVLKKASKHGYRELKESDWCCGGAGAFAFTQPELSGEIGMRKLRNIAATQAETVVAGATSCLLQLESGLAECYPSCKVEHYSVFVSKLLK